MGWGRILLINHNVYSAIAILQGRYGDGVGMGINGYEDVGTRGLRERFVGIIII